jgi:hypothetical protein
MKISCGNYCPLLKKKCIEHKCSWFTQIRGFNPNTGAEVDEWACAVAWMPLMAVEISQKENQTGAAVESFRNEMIKTQRQMHDMIAQSQDLFIQNQKLFLENSNIGIIKASVYDLEEEKKLNPGE